MSQSTGFNESVALVIPAFAILTASQITKLADYRLKHVAWLHRVEATSDTFLISRWTT